MVRSLRHAHPLGVLSLLISSSGATELAEEPEHELGGEPVSLPARNPMPIQRASPAAPAEASVHRAGPAAAAEASVYSLLQEHTLCTPSTYVGWMDLDACVLQARLSPGHLFQWTPGETTSGCKVCPMGLDGNLQSTAANFALFTVLEHPPLPPKPPRSPPTPPPIAPPNPPPPPWPPSPPPAPGPPPPTPPPPSPVAPPAPPPQATAAPTTLSPRGADCGRFGFSWLAPPSPPGLPRVLSYAVAVELVDDEYPRLDLSKPISTLLASGATNVREVQVPNALIDGLNPSSTYEVCVSALNAVGWSDWSRPLRGTTQAASALPSAPESPTQLDSEQCDTALLQLPPLRGGCNGDEQLEVQMQPPGTTSWYKAPTAEPRAAAPLGLGQLRVPHLDPHAGYRFRTVARNAQGSTHGEPTEPLLSGHPPQMQHPPSVTAIASTGYKIQWQGVSGACRPGARWEVSYKRGETGEWQVLVGRQSQEYLDVELRCPEGCSFFVRMQGMTQIDLKSATSTPVPTSPLPPLPSRAVRLEVRANKTEAALPSVAQLRQRLASALSVDAGQLIVRERAEIGISRVVIIVDVISTADHSALAVAGRLAGLLQLQRRPLEERLALALESSLVHLSPDGTLLPVPPVDDGSWNGDGDAPDCDGLADCAAGSGEVVYLLLLPVLSILLLLAMLLGVRRWSQRRKEQQDEEQHWQRALRSNSARSSIPRSAPPRAPPPPPPPPPERDPHARTVQDNLPARRLPPPPPPQCQSSSCTKPRATPPPPPPLPPPPTATELAQSGHGHAPLAPAPPPMPDLLVEIERY